jgi:hypothetical protein
MTAEDVRKTLRNEIGLLGSLIGMAKSYDGKGQPFFTSDAAEIQTSWIRYLRDRATTNGSLADLPDDDLKPTLEAEQEQIQKYIDVHDKSNPDLVEWITFLECEYRLLGDLIKRLP